MGGMRNEYGTERTSGKRQDNGERKRKAETRKSVKLPQIYFNLKMPNSSFIT
jgi:hypothetical protein